MALLDNPTSFEISASRASRPGLTSASNSGVPIDISEMTKFYGSANVLKEINLQVGSGEFLSLLGPSGSGKSTLLMALAGFVKPTSGSIRFGSHDITRLPPHKRGIGVVFQNYALFPNMNVAENIAYPLRIRRCSRSETERRVKAAIGLVRLDGMMDRRIENLSGGQRQRVALARAIVFEPKVLLMDEPLSALDKNLREHMQIEIRRLHQHLGITTIYVTHDQREALTLSDRIAVMNYGRILQIDTPRHLYERPQNRFVAEFIGAAKVLKVERTEAGWSYRGQILKVGSQNAVCGHSQFLVARSEKLRICGPDELADPEYNIFKGLVGEIAYQGESLSITITLGGVDEVTLSVPSDQKTMDLLPAHGGEILIGLHAKDTLVVPEQHA